MNHLTEEIVKTVITRRPEESHKGTFGRAVLIGGNAQYGGAIIMSAQAAIAAGTGLVTVITDQKNHSALHSRLPEAMVVNWQESVLVTELLKTADVILVGPGLGLEAHSKQLLKTVLTQQTAEQWLIIDGSAITLFAEQEIVRNYPQQTIFTPHQREWQRLSGLSIAEQTFEKNREYQQRLQGMVVLKSHRTEIYTAQQVYKNTLGTPAMATGGMGDTLAGIITGFLAQFQNKENAVCAAVYLHSLIGEALATDRYVVLPSEIAAQLPFYMKQFEQ